MARWTKLVLPMLVIALGCGCAHKYSAEEYNALDAKLKRCEQDLNILKAENQQVRAQFTDLRYEARKARGEKEECIRDKQAFLDKQIETLQQNKELLQQISHFKTLMQERKDMAGRVNRIYEYAMNLLDQERLADQVYIIKNTEKIKIILPQRVIFAGPRSAWLTPRGVRLVEKIARGLKQLDPGYIEIGGHTDNAFLPEIVKKVYPNNWSLSQTRAVAVLEIFEAQGIKTNRMCAIAYADTRPVADNSSEEGMSMNRRVEITILP
jgi:chemotaxis protein MotB